MSTRATKKSLSPGTPAPPGSGLSVYRSMPEASRDPIRNPVGMYSGLTRRSAVEDGEHVSISHPFKGPTGTPNRRKE